MAIKNTYDKICSNSETRNKGKRVFVSHSTVEYVVTLQLCGIPSLQSKYSSWRSYNITIRN